MKRAFVVVGPESSGNRLLAALLVRAGCFGHGWEAESDLPLHHTPAVVTRSYPHGNEWPDLRDIYRTLRDRGYMVQALVTCRDLFCTIESQHASQHHPRELAAANVTRAIGSIFAQLADLNCAWTLVPYESLILHPIDAVHRLLERLDLPVGNLGSAFVVDGTEHETISDGNWKHFDVKYLPEE
jgi:hypothetical protein